MMKQVNKEAYRFEKYCGPDRWASYYYQLRELLAIQPDSILEVGGGDGVVGDYIKKNTEVAYTSLDVADDLRPDIVGSIEKIPLADQSVDVAAAFEVLEHIPFDKFETALLELMRVARKRVIISIPHYGPSVRFSFKIPFSRELRFAWKIPHHPTHVFNGQHYWEIGKRGYELGGVRNIIAKHYVINKEFIPYENQYHHFFVLTPRP